MISKEWQIAIDSLNDKPEEFIFNRKLKYDYMSTQTSQSEKQLNDPRIFALKRLYKVHNFNLIDKQKCHLQNMTVTSYRLFGIIPIFRFTEVFAKPQSNGRRKKTLHPPTFSKRTRTTAK